MYMMMDITKERLYMKGLTVDADIRVSNSGLVSITTFSGNVIIEGLYGVDFVPRINGSTKPRPETDLCRQIYDYVCAHYLKFDYEYFNDGCFDEVAVTCETKTTIVITKRIR